MTEISNSPKPLNVPESSPSQSPDNATMTSYDRDHVQQLILDRLGHGINPLTGEPLPAVFDPRLAGSLTPRTGIDPHAFPMAANPGVPVTASPTIPTISSPALGPGSHSSGDPSNMLTATTPSTKASPAQSGTLWGEPGSEASQAEKKTATKPEVKQAQTSDRPESPSDKEIATLAHKDINKALEAGLEKSVEIPHLKVVIDTRQGPGAGSPNIEPSSLAERAPSGSTSAQPAKENSELTSRDNASARTSPAAAEQLNLHDQQHRIEQLRIIQHMLTIDRDQTPTVKITPATESTSSNNTRPDLTPVALEKLRDSFLDKLETIKTQIETTSSRRDKEHAAGATTDKLIQGRGDFITFDPVHHDTKSFLQLRHGDRGIESAKEVLPITKTAAGAAFTPTPLLSASRHAHDRLSSTIRALQTFSRQSRDFQLMKRMDSALERTCLAFVAGLAVGVLSAELAITSTNMALRELLRMLREDPDQDALNQNEMECQAELDQTIEQYLNSENIVPSERGMVADISGVLICGDTREPLAGVLIGSRELGACVTDEQGRFLFSNVKLGLGYSMKFYKPLFALTPDHLSGICGFDSHYTVEVATKRLDREV